MCVCLWFWIVESSTILPCCYNNSSFGNCLIYRLGVAAVCQRWSPKDASSGGWTQESGWRTQRRCPTYPRCCIPNSRKPATTHSLGGGYIWMMDARARMQWIYSFLHLYTCSTFISKDKYQPVRPHISKSLPPPTSSISVSLSHRTSDPATRSETLMAQ